MLYLSSVVPQGGTQEDALCVESSGIVLSSPFRIPKSLLLPAGAFGMANFFMDDTGASSYVKLHFHLRPPGHSQILNRILQV
jgi:hypothetical protein